LLTINPSALLFNQLPTAIINRSQAAAGVNPAGVEVTGLKVPEGKSLLLGGGNINVEGGALRAYGGRIELAGLAAPGVVGLNVAENTLSFSVPNEIQRADISLTNAAEINVRGADGGSITINAQNLSLAGESKLRAGIDTGLGTLQSKAGDIDINATGATTLTDGSFIANVLQPTSVGKGGNINITTGSVSLADRANVNVSTYGQGDAGNVSIQASDSVSLDNSRIYSDVNTGAEGNGGSININAGSVTVQNAAELSSTVSGKGNGGNIIINARDRISFDGRGEEIFSRANTSVQQGGEGKAGDIQVTTGTLSLNNGAFFSSSTNGKGDAGNIQVTTGTLSLTNGAFFISSTNGKGDAGNITIDASDTISFDGGSEARSSVFSGGVGKGGDIRVTTGSLSLTNGAQLTTNVSGQGDAGNITIDARDTVTFEGVVGNAMSGVQSSLITGGVGNAGDIRVTTGSLTVQNGAALTSNTDGRGNAGNITIDARDTVTFEGTGKDSGLPSQANTELGSNGVGNGGNIRVNARALLLKNGGQLNANSIGQGNAGSITINTRDTVAFDGVASNGNYSAAQTSGRQGNGGDIRVTTGSLSLTNGAQLTTEVLGQGDAGNITVDARDTVNLDGVVGDAISGIYSSLLSGVGKGGDIRVTTGSLSVTNGVLSSSTDGRGNAGNITINARDTVTFDGVGNGNRFSSQANSTLGKNGVGNGGNISVNARALLLKNGAQLNANSSGQGNAGSITIDTRDTVAFDGVGSNGSRSGAQTFGYPGNGGDIQVTTGTLSLTNGGQLFTSAQGNAGNITINARDAVNFDGVGSNGSSSGAVSLSLPGGVAGKGGDIQVTTGSLSVTNGAQLLSSTAARGNGGNITIDARDTVKFDGTGSNQASSGAYSTVEPDGVGNAGNIKLTTGSLSLNNGVLPLLAQILTQKKADLPLPDAAVCLLALTNPSALMWYG
jgi:large exoprotein involved in heme utilization and adhesion